MRGTCVEQHRPLLAVPDEADAGPEMDGPGDPVTSGGKKDDALPGGTGDAIDRLLQRLSIVGQTIADETGCAGGDNGQ